VTFESQIGWLRSIVSFFITVLFLWVLKKLHTVYAGALWGVAAVSLQLGALKVIAVFEKRHKLKFSRLEAAR
jgi:hypothetical protein